MLLVCVGDGENEAVFEGLTVLEPVCVPVLLAVLVKELVAVAVCVWVCVVEGDCEEVIVGEGVA